MTIHEQHPLDQITERVERLLARHEELIRSNAVLREQLALLTRERDTLQSRLNAARARVDALLDKLPVTAQSAATASLILSSPPIDLPPMENDSNVININNETPNTVANSEFTLVLSPPSDTDSDGEVT